MQDIILKKTSSRSSVILRICRVRAPRENPEKGLHSLDSMKNGEFGACCRLLCHILLITGIIGCTDCVTSERFQIKE